MVVFASQCPNSDTATNVESSGAARVFQKLGFALTLFSKPPIFDEHVDPPGLARWPVDV